ncbi:MAG: hypothetical protein JW751_17965 [Polyangiaceae bacterium]|nr:hypothetical protein [Polyangiaceae bacterium]
MTLQLRKAAVSVAFSIVEGCARHTQSDYLQALLHDPPTSDQKASRRRTARVGPLLRLLRAHGILEKIPRTHRYQATITGRQALAAIIAATDATTAQLACLAA